MITVSRLESMSPRGFLRLIIQDDGDVFVTVQQHDTGDEIGHDTSRPIKCASVEFCTHAGGGGSRHTWKALQALAVAMAKDNADKFQQGRAGEWSGAELLPPVAPTSTEPQ